MSSWADMNEDSTSGGNANEAVPSGPPQRKKLQLKPRSAHPHASEQSHSSSKSNPFGAAKPREEVLASKGIDAKKVDEKITKKATVVHFTREQNIKIEEIQEELKAAENALREANENELPEEEYRVKAEAKRKELHDLMEQYKKENEEKKKEEEANKPARPHFERPSERRKRLDEEHGRRHPQEEPQADAYSSFGGKNHHRMHHDRQERY